MLKPVSARAQWVNIFLLVCIVIAALRPTSSRQQNTNILQQLHIKTCTYFERKILGTEERWEEEKTMDSIWLNTVVLGTLRNVIFFLYKPFFPLCSVLLCGKDLLISECPGEDLCTTPVGTCRTDGVHNQAALKGGGGRTEGSAQPCCPMKGVALSHGICFSKWNLSYHSLLFGPSNFISLLC